MSERDTEGNGRSSGASSSREEARDTVASAHEPLQANDQFRTIFNSVTDGIVIFEPSGRILEINRVVCERLGYEREELIGTPVTDLDTEQSAALFESRMKEVLRQGFATYEVDHRCRDGSVFPIEVGSSAMEFDGKPAILSVQRDITERRRAQAEADAQRRYVEELIDAIPTPVVAKDRAGRIQQGNTVFLNAWGLTREAAFGKTVKDLGLPGGEKSQSLDESVVQTGRVHQNEAWVAHVDGARRMLMTRAPLRVADGTILGTITTAIDITERYLAEQELRKSEERFRTLFHEAGDAMFIIEAGGDFIEVNSAAARGLGYTVEEMKGKGVPDICLPDQIEALPAFYPLGLKPGGISFETMHVRKDGSEFPVELAVTPMELDGKQVTLTIARDVSERKRAEAERTQLESQLRQAQKMEGIGRLASGIAHDFNNLLTAISGYAGFAIEGLADDDPRRHDIEEIQAASARATTLVRQLLAFSRANKMEPKVIQPGEVVARLERLLKPMIGEDIDLEVDVSGSHSSVLADPSQIEQVVVNFAVNARDAMSKGGRLRIRVADVAVDEETALASRAGLGPNVLLEVSDDGAGMDADTMQHLFEPFFTTKGPGEGTGLGLAVVYGIVQSWGGGLSVKSSPGEGSVFSVYLPVVDAAPESPSPAEIRGSAIGGRGRKVLVVEDDDVVRRFTVRVLEEAGYEVSAPRTAPDAVVLGRQAAVDLLLTDVVMPTMLGVDVATQVGAVHPDMPVLFMSGYADRHGSQAHSRFDLSKPFAATDLLAAVEKALGERQVPR